MDRQTVPPPSPVVLKRSRLSSFLRTAATSARALAGGMRVCEVPVSYGDRIGTSKLSVVGDGLRVLGSFCSAVLRYKPERLFLFGATIFILAACLLAPGPATSYRRGGQ